MKRRVVVSLLSVLLVGMGARCTHPAWRLDAVTAAAAQDPTAILRVEGCGTQPLWNEGYAYCRVFEGALTSTMGIRFAGPAHLNCGSESCIEFTVFFPDGRPAYTDTILDAGGSKFVSWERLSGSKTFTVGDRGFYPYLYTITWIDGTGVVRHTIAEGELRLRVIAGKVCDENHVCREYQPLREAADSKDFVWKFSLDGQSVQMTTGARTRVEGVKP